MAPETMAVKVGGAKSRRTVKGLGMAPKRNQYVPFSEAGLRGRLVRFPEARAHLRVPSPESPSPPGCSPRSPPPPPPDHPRTPARSTDPPPSLLDSSPTTSQRSSPPPPPPPHSASPGPSPSRRSTSSSSDSTRSVR